ncbi:Hexokinase-1 [Arthrobotrys entomopaga]|nr:Hexokinase-1 [Arthrobotrys entomopaga]
MAPDKELSRVKKLLEHELPMDLSLSVMGEMSRKLTAAYVDGLENSTASMIPSHIYHLPSGTEQGYFLSADLGGSTLRVALVHLEGRKIAGHRNKERAKPMNIVEIKSWSGVHIENLKTLTGDEFFDWIAMRIGEVVIEKFGSKDTPILPLGLSWSFPIENTSIYSGKIQDMGKGFRVAEGLIGTDLRTHFKNAFTRQGLKISLEAIINDSLAALLSHAYLAPATRCALILGTGTNAAVSLPISMFPGSKTHSNRPASAREVLTNTEFSMYGKKVYPVTKWDDALDAAMPRPGFQPLEYLIGGGYLGEIARRLILDLKDDGLFGKTPASWDKPYGLSTEALAAMEEIRDDKPPKNYKNINAALSELPDMPLSARDARILKQVALHISSRAANYCGITLHALIKFRERGDESPSSSLTKNIVPIAFVGSVMEKYPNLLDRTQRTLDKMTGWTKDSKDSQQRIVLEFAPESAIFGAAVSVAAALEKRLGSLNSPIFSAPTSLPLTERSSNASTLMQPGSGLEEANKSLESVTTPKKEPAASSIHEPPFEQLADNDPSKAPFWNRVKDFFHNVFRKVFKKKREV